ncbi:MAG: hypothetical protein ACI802_001125 [Candidatus Paceibacteria bacterium]
MRLNGTGHFSGAWVDRQRSINYGRLKLQQQWSTAWHRNSKATALTPHRSSWPPAAPHHLAQPQARFHPGCFRRLRAAPQAEHIALVLARLEPPARLNRRRGTLSRLLRRSTGQRTNAMKQRSSRKSELERAQLFHATPPARRMTGKNHSHWLTLLGFGSLQPPQA